MERKDLISIQQFCEHYDLPIAFINTLYEYELVEIITIQEIPCLRKTKIRDIEKMIRLHYELNIGLEALDVVYHLLNRVSSLKEEIIMLNNRLKFYENEDFN